MHGDRVFRAALLLIAMAGASHAQRLRLSPCRVPGIDTELRCGTFEARENRRDSNSRLIPLEVLIVPSRAAHPRSDPVVMVSPGGPGTTNSEALPIRAWYSWMRDDRDIVIVDLRGTSGSSRLDCAMVDANGSAAQYLGPLFPRDRIARCRDSLARIDDLRFYTTPIIVQDFDDVLHALGYTKVNLWGASWGTRVEYLWLRMHPGTVRSAILAGSAPVNFLNPLPHARNAQIAIDGLFAECRREPTCHSSFPNIAAELNSVLARLDRRAATVHVRGSSPEHTGATLLTWLEEVNRHRTARTLYGEIIAVVAEWTPNDLLRFYALNLDDGGSPDDPFFSWQVGYKQPSISIMLSNER